MVKVKDALFLLVKLALYPEQNQRQKKFRLCRGLPSRFISFFFKWNFHMSPYVRLLVGWSVLGCLVRRSVLIF